MTYRKKDLVVSEKETLLAIIDELQAKVKKKNSDLQQVRMKLDVARSKILKMKDTVEYQRNRIVELYPNLTQTLT